MPERKAPLQDLCSRFHWPSPEPPTGSVVFWRGGIQPDSARWEREYVPRSEAEALAEALEKLDAEWCEWLPGHATDALAEYRSRHPKETP